MKLNMSNVPHDVLGDHPEPGDIYTNMRGHLLLVIAISGGTAYYVKFSPDGEPAGTGQYGVSYLKERRMKVGRLAEPLMLDVIWTGEES